MLKWPKICDFFKLEITKLKLYSAFKLPFKILKQMAVFQTLFHTTSKKKAPCWADPPHTAHQADLKVLSNDG